MCRSHRTGCFLVRGILPAASRRRRSRFTAGKSKYEGGGGQKCRAVSQRGTKHEAGPDLCRHLREKKQKTRREVWNVRRSKIGTRFSLKKHSFYPPPNKNSGVTFDPRAIDLLAFTLSDLTQMLPFMSGHDGTRATGRRKLLPGNGKSPTFIKKKRPRFRKVTIDWRKCQTGLKIHCSKSTKNFPECLILDKIPILWVLKTVAWG